MKIKANNEAIPKIDTKGEQNAFRAEHQTRICESPESEGEDFKLPLRMQLPAVACAEFTYPLALLAARQSPVQNLQAHIKVTAELVIVRFTVILALSLTRDGFHFTFAR